MAVVDQPTYTYKLFACFYAVIEESLSEKTPILNKRRVSKLFGCSENESQINVAHNADSASDMIVNIFRFCAADATQCGRFV